MRPLGDAPPTGKRNDIKAILTLLPYLWPRGAVEIRARVVLSVLCLVVAKGITVGFPILLKMAVDQLSGVQSAAAD